MTCHRHLPTVLAMNVVLVVLYVPFPLTLTVWVRAGVPAQVVSPGAKSANVMVPPAPVVAPVNIPESLGLRFCAVESAGVFLSMTIVSDVQTLVAPLLLPSPVYAAW